MQILISEDDFTSRAVLAGILKKRGYDVLETTNGIEAWQVLQQKDAPQLVILDWMMPEMDGPSLLQQVRALQTDCPPYVIMLTAKSEKLDVISGLDAGANDYLSKPFDPDELLARVEVGQRMVEMQLRLHRQRANAQCFRVEASRRLADMEDALAAKDEQLRQLQMEQLVLTARLQAVRPDERPSNAAPQSSVVCERGLVAAIQQQIEETGKHTRLAFRASLPAAELPLDQSLALDLFWIVQEALTNVGRHAQATEVDIQLACAGRELELCIQDNGRGFPPGLLVGSKTLGLLGIRERARASGGSVEFLNEPGKGATVRLHITLPAPMP